MSPVAGTFAAAAALAFSAAVLAHHGEPAAHGAHADADQPASKPHHGPHRTAARPYAGQEQRPIKALPPEEVKGLLEGAGLGFAKTAELNRHPGPMHALEHADDLALSAKQRQALESLMRAHKAEAAKLGAALVRLEGELDRLFAERRATPESVDRLTAAIGAAQGRVRASHLRTHIAATRLLDEKQIARYDELRGYAAGGGAAHGAHHTHGGHAK